MERTDEMHGVPEHAVDLVLMTVHDSHLKILLRKKQEQDRSWMLPGDMISGTEDMETAVQRILEHHIRVTDRIYFRQLYTLGSADRMPGKRVYSTAYLTLTPYENIRTADGGQYVWFDITKSADEISREGRHSLLVISDGGCRMAYEVRDQAMHNYVHTDSRLQEGSADRVAYDHIKFINIAMDQVQHRAASTGILFNLLPAECTLREIQNVYEAVTGRQTDTANFRRDIRKMLLAAGKKKKSGSRMAELYRFNPMYTYLKENL